ncbi:unnamed protein product, partial [marine sediment metagenome]
MRPLESFDVLLFLIKCANSDNPKNYISEAINCDVETCYLINLALECNWKIRPTFKELIYHKKYKKKLLT